MIQEWGTVGSRGDGSSSSSSAGAASGEIPWCFSQVKGTIEEEIADGQSHCLQYTLPQSSGASHSTFSLYPLATLPRLPFHYAPLPSISLPPSFTSPPADIISAVEFNHDGEFLATGDKGGRVVIFQRGGLPPVSGCWVVGSGPCLLWVSVRGASCVCVEAFYRQTEGPSGAAPCVVCVWVCASGVCLGVC